jgi:putative transposase
VLHEAGQMVHRGRAKKRQRSEVPSHVANRPAQVWVWTSRIDGSARSLPAIYASDTCMREVVGWEMYEVESMQLSSTAGCNASAKGPMGSWCCIADDNWPDEGARRCWQRCSNSELIPSFSRPMVSDDDAYAESFFDT